MTARANLTTAVAISERLDLVTRALDRLNAGEQPSGIVFRSEQSGVLVVEVPLPAAAVTNLLTNLQTALQTALTNLGVS